VGVNQTAYVVSATVESDSATILEPLSELIGTAEAPCECRAWAKLPPGRAGTTTTAVLRV
jgi:hypothetical protein